MTKLKYEVKYISNSCTQTDELLNHPHQSVAESLYDLLKNHNEIQHPVIGLEGSWGSGKSQVISILQKIISDQKLSSKYKFLTYDIWSAQEDLTRRSFLDSVLSEVKGDEVHFNTEQIKEDYEKLNATITKRSTKSFPLVRLFFAILLLIPVFIFVINSIESAFGYNPNAPLTYDELKGWISIVFSVVALVLFIIAYCEEVKDVKNDNELKDKTEWEQFQIIIGRLFYIFKAKDVEKTDFETILKDEPSISRFQNFFDHVYRGLKDNCVLVIVFDNMDRLSDSQKLMSTWSLLHTFFAEKEYEGKVWAIVPYARQQLSELITGKDGDKTSTEFINKTFFTTFRIPEPIMGSWKSFLNSKLDLAFTPALSDEDKNYVTLIFSRSMAGKVIRPRDIIAFINRLVALYSQHHYEDVPLRYIALYAQYESQIAKTPIESILNYEGFKNMVPLVGKEHVSQWLSSIYYNLPSSSALEVVYDREIVTFLQSDYEVFEDKDEAQEAYQRLSSNELFHHHIEEFFNKDVDLSELKLENIFYLLKQDNISKGTRNRIYNSVTEQLDKLKEQLYQYGYWMEHAFLHYDIQNTNSIIKALIPNTKDDFEAYYQTIIPLLQLKQKRQDLKIVFGEYKTESAKDMVEYYEYLKETNALEYFRKSKIGIETDKLLEYMKEGTSGSVLFGNNTDKVYGLLQLLKSTKQDLKPITEAILNANINIASQEHIQVERIYRAFEIVKEDQDMIPSYTLIDANGTKFLDIPEYLACTLVQLKNHGNNKNQINNCLSSDLQANKAVINEILPKYFNYDFLIKIALSSGNTMLKEICVSLIDSSKIIIEKADQILSSTTQIVDDIFDGNFEEFISFLDKKLIGLKEKTTIQIIDVDSFWWENISKDTINKHPIFKAICDQWLLEFNAFIGSTWNEEFANVDGNASLILQKLDEIAIIDKDFWAAIPVEQVSKAFIDAIVNNASIDFVLFKKWKKYASKASLAKLANDTLYAIDNPRTIEKTRFIQFVELLWENSELIKNGERANGIFDDYISEYLSSDAHDHIGTFICNHQIQVHAILDCISDDRRQLFVGKLRTIQSCSEKSSKAFTIMQVIIDKYEIDEK